MAWNMSIGGIIYVLVSPAKSTEVLLNTNFLGMNMMPLFAYRVR